jgi:hypothetical protein
MISLVNHASIVPVESAIVCAEHSGIGDGPFFVVSSVKGEHFWLSKVQQTASGWECESAISTTESLGSILGDIQAVFADEFIPEEAHSLLMRNEIPIYPLVLSATALLRIGVKLFKDGCSVHPSELLPMYPREPEAVRRWKAKDSTK